MGSVSDDEARERWQLGLNFFFQLATIGVFLPFFTVFLTQVRGFSGSQSATIILTIPLLNMVMNPVYGILADVWFTRRAVYRTALVGAALVFPWFYVAESFWAMALLVALYALFRLPGVSILNAAVLDRSAGLPHAYGRVRAVGSLGFIVFAVWMGWWTEHFGIARLPDGLVAGIVLHILVGWNAPVDLAARTSRPAPGAWRVLLTDPRWALFLLGVGLSRVAETGYNVFYSVHLVDLGFTPGFAGSMWSLGVASEVAMLLLAHRAVARFSLDAILALTYAVAALRWLATALVSDAGLFAALQLTHGITFSLFYVAAVEWAHRNAPQGLKTTAQALSSAVMFGVAGVVGTLAAGPIYDRGGGTAVFYSAAGWSGAAAVVALLPLVLTRLRQP